MFCDSFALSKDEFRDNVLMRYGWPLRNLPTTCACGQAFPLSHSRFATLYGSWTCATTGCVIYWQEKCGSVSKMWRPSHD